MGTSYVAREQTLDIARGKERSEDLVRQHFVLSALTAILTPFSPTPPHHHCRRVTSLLSIPPQHRLRLV
jgi:hypothetical protein